jgi:hypothetical protein
MYYEAVIASSSGDDATLAKSLIISLRRHNLKLVLKASTIMHTFLAATQGEVFDKLRP